MLKEIGGYFEMEEYIGEEYHKDGIALNCARNCLALLIRLRGVSKIYIPYFMCDALTNLLENNKIDYEQYYIDYNFAPQIEKKIKKSEYIYIVNYYGQLSSKDVIALKGKYGNIILDNVQAFFSEKVAGVDTIYSCRKYFGVPDGGYLVTGVEFSSNLEIQKSSDRMRHILGRYEDNATNYYVDFKKNDELFDYDEIKYMSRISHNILRGVDYDYVKNIRKRNFNLLDSKLNKINKLKLIDCPGPFMYPFYINNGDELRQMLISKKIYVPVLWPNVLKDMKKDTVEYDFANNIVPLPIDQRYNENDMNNIVNEIAHFLGRRQL